MRVWNDDNTFYKKCDTCDVRLRKGTTHIKLEICAHCYSELAKMGVIDV